MELLILLVENAERLVTREEIITRLWGPNTFLDTDQSINSSIRKIRAALRDDPNHPKYVLTLVCKGYRFIAPLTTDLVQCFPPSISHKPIRSPAPAPEMCSAPSLMGQRKRRLVRQATPIVVLFAMCASAWFVYRRGHPATHGVHSIVVLPLANLSADREQE